MKSKVFLAISIGYRRIMYMLQAFSRMNRIDFDDINYKKVYIKKEVRNNSKLSKSLLIIIRKTIYWIILDIKNLFILNKPLLLKNKHICYYGTKNQYNALKNISTSVSDAELCSITNSEDAHLYTSPGYALSWVLLPFLIFRFRKTRYEKPHQNFANFIESNFFIYGFFIWYKCYFQWIKPKSFILANDHSPHHRLIKMVCKSLKIPSVYIQHASVTNKFPKLDFTISLLEGMDAHDKYKGKGIDSRIFYIGMLKFDDYRNMINVKDHFETLGISVNHSDDFTRIEKLLFQINQKLPTLKIIIRPHPRDKRHQQFIELSREYNYLFSNSNNENSFDYLQKVDVNIAAESSIHLEAAMMNVYPIYYKFGDDIRDNYGYIKNGLISDVYDNEDQLLSILYHLKKFKPVIRDRSKYYVSTVGTKYDGNSAKLVNDILSEELV